jgi:hypothetical protein
MTDAEFTNSLQMLKSKMGDKEIDAQTIMFVLKSAMEVVETTKAKGIEQRDLTIKLVRQIVIDAPISDDKEKLLLDMIDQGILANTIDLVIKASKGELDINDAVALATGCCATFLSKKKN